MREKPQGKQLPDMNAIMDSVPGVPRNATEGDEVPQSATKGDKAPQSATERDRGPLEKHHLRVHSEDWKQLERVARSEGISASTKLRMILRQWIGS